MYYTTQVTGGFQADLNNQVVETFQPSTNVIQEYLTFNDLPALGSSPQSVRSRFSSIYGTNPDGIALNNETYFSAVQPPITVQYGHYCYKNVGTVQYVNRPTDINPNVILAQDTLTNNTNEPFTTTITLTGSWTKSSTVTSSTTTGLKITTKLSIKKVFEIGGEVSFSTTIGSSEATSETFTVSKAVTVTVPAQSRRNIQLTAKIARESADFSAPITVDGYFGANFPRRVGPGGHYFWFNPARDVLNATSGTLRGTVTNVSSFDFQTVVQPAYSLLAEQQEALESAISGDPSEEQLKQIQQTIGL
ncbi:ETX/MTX2 family pore-forming toxin [Bacillus toyonensis]|uniref:Crystal protein n=1 Tax=Bacillus thuringiensis TaxID=1428 RepID=Q6AW28_BACTU|nr:ETX/MTX2 family pore-forming toxin [Bacillus toyonensis]MED3088006.1 ETX/MTX2 family pore-forming toxin [Bacillus toyonensis]BAD35170.1 crystal protein [Bacillus thuringiensis]BAW83526.1 mosquitocidal toxin [synthetic construct]